ncbi:MAG: prephenate dehydrogenase [Clostridia bacterium]
MADKFEKITIVGLGVIGGSLAMRLSKLGYTVFGVDLNFDTINRAKTGKFIVEGDSEPQRFFEQSDLVVMALYPNQIADYICKYHNCLKQNCIIIDVAGLKSHFVEPINNTLRDDIDFVFCHPMAGREKKGFEYADDKVFDNANFIITPTTRNKKESVDKIVALAKQMNFGTIKCVTPEFHDKIIAFTSQLPHAIAVALINSDTENSQTGDFVGDSYRDLTRIANINECLWSELFLNNSQNLLYMIEEFEKQLEIIKNAVKYGDKKTLENCFVMSTERRNKLNKQNK